MNDQELISETIEVIISNTPYLDDFRYLGRNLFKVILLFLILKFTTFTAFLFLYCFYEQLLKFIQSFYSPHSSVSIEMRVTASAFVVY